MENGKRIKRNSKTPERAIGGGYVPPQDVLLEQVILGSILIDRYAMDNIATDFNENLFYDPKHQYIARAIIDIYRQSIPVDLVTVTTELKKQGNLESSGGVQYIASLPEHAGSAMNIEVHIRLLQEYSLKRTLITVSSDLLRKCYNDEEDVFDVYNEAQMTLEASTKAVMNYKIEDSKAIHERLVLEHYRLLDSKQSSGVPTGLRRLDKVTNGFQKSDLIIIAGRPAMGKTAVTLSMVVNPAIYHKIPIGIFSLEMSKEQVMSRLQAYATGLDVSKIVKKQLNVDEINVLVQRGQALADSPIYIDDTANLSVMELKGKCRKLVKEHGVQIIVIDYLQLMRSGIKTQIREQEIAEISRGLKIIAKELNVPVIALSQLNRSVETRGGDKKPQLSDLRESGQIEQDADMIMFCYRPEYYNFTEYQCGDREYDANGLFMLLIAKHRNGELGEIPLKFEAEQAKITNLDEDNRRGSTIQTPPQMSNAIKPPKEEPNLSSSPFSKMDIEGIDEFNIDFNNKPDETPF